MDKLYSLAKSFKYAWNGIRFCVRHEKNMRIHIVAALYVMYFSQFYNFTRAEYILLIIICVIVLSLEMLNTAIEVVIDKVSPEYSALAKVGKDVAAGAVFVSALAAIIIGVCLFWDIDTFKLIWAYLTGDLFNLAMLIGFTGCAFLFITSAKKRKIKGKVNK